MINGDDNYRQTGEIIEEQLKAKVLTRLLHEYRRSVQEQKSRMMQQLIEDNNDTKATIDNQVGNKKKHNFSNNKSNNRSIDRTRGSINKSANSHKSRGHGSPSTGKKQSTASGKKNDRGYQSSKEKRR